MPVLPLAWNTVKNLVSLIPGEVNIPLTLSIVAEVELNGGGFDKIFATLINQADLVFPDPTFRHIALFALAELQKIAAAPPTPTAVN